MKRKTICNKIVYTKGEILGNNNITYLKEVRTHILPSGGKKRKALFKCYCNNEFEAMIGHIKNDSTTSCGCRPHFSGKYNSSWKGGVRSHPLYKNWLNIRTRCYNKNAISYKNYGGRGITVYNEWISDSWAYINYCMSLPNSHITGLTIDRIDNDKNYEPGNLRWADEFTQNINRRGMKNSITGYDGISIHSQSDKWRATITVDKQRISLGLHNTIKEALNARNNYIINNKLIEYEIQNYKQKV